MTNEFIHDDFLLQSDTAKILYHDYAKELPIVDYHCHLPPKDIAENRKFGNLTEIWLGGDHYKWRAMRTLGVNEKYITGDASDYEKFEKWAYTTPYTMRNPLYHWSHLELKRYFGIDKLLSPATAREIYEECNAQLATDDLSVHGIQKKMNVELVCTVEDPLDDLVYHKQLKTEGYGVNILTTFRPDAVLNIDDAAFFDGYLSKLEQVSGVKITDFDSLMDAMKSRVQYYHDTGCRLSDHGLEELYSVEFSGASVDAAIQASRSGKAISGAQILEYKSAVLFHLGKLYHEFGWTQLFHLGALRNTNSRLNRVLGADCGVDSIGDFKNAQNMARFFNRLDNEDKLTKTIIFNLNPADNEIFATMIGNFNDGSIKAKINFGPGWWFLDQKDGMEKQLNALSNMSLISQFIGMVTDSRSFLSYPRHEYFRRTLCNLIGEDVKKGELPNDIEWLGKLVSDMCYYNAKNYFGFGN
ncbi:glucuronate isomerase [Reichenbachiella sp. 5M10]|uniref:glucuronate isomerase n=1 Tax=Reichenbachiella sp. 5M10 TaxID=1889772 RepID=UPI000C157A14|nr:glucuronate isomerase [Reichenbachiella sp. 5M10]PIB35775.1 glucuronate isomerase [Reichenbachiella sp. 5M10]